MLDTQYYRRDIVVVIAISKTARPDHTQRPWIMSERSDFSSTPQQSKRDYSQKQICFCACISRPFSKVRVRTISHPVEFILVIATSEWNSKQRICAHKCQILVRGSPPKTLFRSTEHKEALFQVRQKGLRASLTSFQFCIYKNVAC